MLDLLDQVFAGGDKTPTTQSTNPMASVFGFSAPVQKEQKMLSDNSLQNVTENQNL
jgi:hypothetical protein